MAIKLEGPLSFDSDIVREFISDNAIPADFRPHSLSEYFRLGEYVPDADPQNQDIPLDSSVNPIGLEEIKFSDFYGAVNQINIDFFKDPAQPTNVNSYVDKNGTQQNVPINSPLNMSTIANSFVSTPSPTGPHSVPYKFKFNDGVVFNNSIQTGGSFGKIIIENQGVIAGRGGDGVKGPSTGNPGQAAIKVTHPDTTVVIDNLSDGTTPGTGYISGGGGGGRGHTQSPNVSCGGGGGWNGGNGGPVSVPPGGAFSSPRNGGAGQIITSKFSDNQGGPGVRIFNFVAGGGGFFDPGPVFNPQLGGKGGGGGGATFVNNTPNGQGFCACSGGGGGNRILFNAPGGSGATPNVVIPNSPGTSGGRGGTNSGAGNSAPGGKGGGGWGAAGGGGASGGKAVQKFGTNVSISYTPSAGNYYGTKDT